MDNKGYISKRKKGSSLYEELHEEALEILQKLSGGVWTDYNEHDPGVTLLENISYAITELAHKTTLPIEDILVSSKKEALKSGDNGLFIASDILTTTPITFNDYRKFFIDKVHNVKNLWIHPVDNYDKELNNVKGLLHLYVEKYQYHVHQVKEAEENKDIKEQITQIYNEHRNLCEDLYAIEIYKPLTLVVSLKIKLLDTVDAEGILANILHSVNDYLAPEVSYSSLKQLQEENISINEIFNGPNLVNGFIKGENLRGPLEVIKISEIIKMISRIPGVLNINNFSLNYVNPITKKEHVIKENFKVPKNMTGRILFPKSNENLIFENSSISFQPDLKKAKKQLSFIQALKSSKFKAASNSLNKISIPSGTYQDITYHYPIRKQFPEIYGIGDRGIGNSATPLRKAQIKQLQAYLMPFDQLIVNFLAQLANIYTLYDINENKEASYFTNTLPDIADLLDVIEPVNTSYNLEETKIYWDKITNELNVFFDNHSSIRLNKVASQLLSRYNEAFETYSLLKINQVSYGDAIPINKFEEQLLVDKQELVKQYATISYNRSKSFNYKEGKMISGVLKKIAILLGINNFEMKSLTKSISESGIRIHPKTLEVSVVVSEIDIYTSDEHFEIIEIDDIKVKESVKESLYNNMHYVGEKELLLNDVMQYGIDKANYIIKKDLKIADYYYYYVLYQRSSNKSNIVHIAKNEIAAENAIKKSINYLVNINQKSEGFLLLEHVLLLPSCFEDNFGFQIDFSLLDSSVKIILSHNSKNTLVKRDEIIDELINGLLNSELQLSVLSINDEFQLEISSLNGDVLAISNNFISRVLLEETIDKLKNILTITLKETIEEVIKCLVFYNNYSVNEDFFSFKMSFIMPSWPVRFQNKNFRKVFENTIYEEIPVHIVSNLCWLNYEELYLFESLYFKWMDLLQLNNTGQEQMECAYELILLLQEFTNDVV
ncbi:hypothetical protein [Tenacibaculum salmonis]|uniref:hypothetical protein n=1 Tax=Tenacibaculum sp. P3-BQ1 TaxID=3232310 RepID=UPI0034DF4FFF